MSIKLKRPVKTRQMHPVHDRLDELTECISGLVDAIESGASVEVVSQPHDDAELVQIKSKLSAAFRTIAQMAETSRKQDAVFKAVVAFMMSPSKREYWPENQPEDIQKLMSEYGIDTSERL